jgi:hypothetical protein
VVIVALGEDLVIGELGEGSWCGDVNEECGFWKTRLDTLSRWEVMAI